MLLVVVVALELALFQGVWEIVVIPSVMMAFVGFNLGLVFLLIRPRSFETRIVGLIWGCVAAFFAATAYMLTVDPSRGSLGVLGTLATSALASSANSVTDQKGAPATILRFAASHMPWLESGLIDLFGLAIVIAGGGIQNSMHLWRARALAAPPGQLAPLDDPAAAAL
jgi:hypothetical protein